MKRAIIKRAMKWFGRVPRSDDMLLSEIFRHKSFTEASNQERERIMQKSSEFKFLCEYQHPFDSYFGFDLAPLLRGKVVLDLGCFTGGKSVAYAERYRLDKIYGIDIRDVYIEAAQRFAKTKGIKAEFVCATGENLPFEDEKFDAICSHDVFEHVRDVEQVLSQCNRVLKRKGKLYVVFPSYFGPIEHHLSLVTATPFIHYFFSGRDLIDVYNEIVNERESEASYWYKRSNPSLEMWERCNIINGMTKRKFRQLIKHGNWGIYYERNSPPLRDVSRKHPHWRLIRYMIYPFAQLPILEEFLCGRIVYILEKP